MACASWATRPCWACARSRYQCLRIGDPADEHLGTIGQAAGNVAAVAPAGERLRELPRDGTPGNAAGRRRTGTGTAAHARAPRCRTPSSPAGSRPASPAAKAKAEHAARRRRHRGILARSRLPWARIAALACKRPVLIVALATTAAPGLAAALTGAALVFGGLYDVASTTQHWQATFSLVDGTRQSAWLRARHIAEPPLADESMAARRRLLSRQVRAVPWRAGGGAGRHRQEHAAAARPPGGRAATAPARALLADAARNPHERHAGLGVPPAGRGAAGAGRLHAAAAGPECRAVRRADAARAADAGLRARRSPRSRQRLRRTSRAEGWRCTSMRAVRAT